MSAAETTMQAETHPECPSSIIYRDAMNGSHVAMDHLVENTRGDEAFIYITAAAMLIGLWIILQFLFSEWTLARKKWEDSTVKFTWIELLHYRLDHYLSTSKWTKTVLLLSGTFILIMIGAFLLTLATDFPITTSTWIAWTYVADPGTHADAEGTLVRFVSFVITIGGMLVFALMIGIISDAISEKVDEMKKGTARVIESNHTLMLGWSDKSLAIIKQTALANESEGGGTIVVLSEHEKAEMEATLKGAVDVKDNALQLLGTQVVFRSGNPLMENELIKVSVLTARAIIVLSPDDTDPDEADSRMVRQVLCLKGFHGLDCHAVVEMQDVDNKALVELVAPDFVEVVVSHDIIGRLMIQCAREPGLAHVLEGLMGFEGSEFYIESWPEIVGKTFLEITCRFDDAVPIGIKTKDGKIKINPKNSYVVEEGDHVLCLAEDNDTYCVNDGKYTIECGKVPSGSVPQQMKEKMLFCGWRRDMADMIMQLEEYVIKGSELWLFNSVPAQERYELLKDKGNKDELALNNLSIKNVVGNPIVRRDLCKLVAQDTDGSSTGEVATLDQFDSILILADDAVTEKGTDMQTTDSRSLSCLLIIQDIQRLFAKTNGENESSDSAFCNPICEILDTRTRSLLHLANSKGYVMSNQIVSSVIAQVAEDRDMNVVLCELLSAEGCESYIRDISYYLDLEKENRKSFWDVALRARQRREVAVGYKPRGLSYLEAEKFLLNPPSKPELREWKQGDKVICFAF